MHVCDPENCRRRKTPPRRPRLLSPSSLATGRRTRRSTRSSSTACSWRSSARCLSASSS